VEPLLSPRVRPARRRADRSLGVRPARPRRGRRSSRTSCRPWKPGLGAACLTTRRVVSTAPPATWRSTGCGGSEPTPRHCRAGRRRDRGIVAARSALRRRDRRRTASLLFVCCHEAVPAESRVAPPPPYPPPPPPPRVADALRFFSTAEIARALLTTDANVQKRIERGAGSAARAGRGFETPAAAQLCARLDAVLTVVYLPFQSGPATSTHGDMPIRRDLCDEARRLSGCSPPIPSATSRRYMPCSR